MALPSSGLLSINDIVGEFGGTAPHGLQEYYKDGGLVPSSKTDLVIGSYTTPVRNSNYAWLTHKTNLQLILLWNGSYNFRTPSSRFVVTYLDGTYRYSRSGGAITDGGYWSYQIMRRFEGNQTVTVNTGVPTTGSLSIHDFYGAEAA